TTEGLPERSRGSRWSRNERWLNWSATDRIAKHGVVRWPRIDLAHVIEQRYGVKLAERSVGALLRRLWVPADIGSTSMSRAGWRPPRAHKKLFRSGPACVPPMRATTLGMGGGKSCTDDAL